MRRATLDQQRTVHEEDALRVKVKLEQEVVLLSAKLAELNIKQNNVLLLIEEHRLLLDKTSKHRAFCIAATDVYNEIDRLEKLEMDFKAKTATFGIGTKEERESELKEEKQNNILRSYEKIVYRNNCVQARKLQDERNKIWSELESYILERESLKSMIKTTTDMLTILRRVTKGKSSATTTSSTTSTTTSSTSSSTKSTATTINVSTKKSTLHARQLSCEDREQWNEIEESAITRGELEYLAKLYSRIDSPEWSKLITLCKLKLDIDQKVSQSRKLSC
jgi:hypothetical protein